jgi:PhnB protein
MERPAIIPRIVTPHVEAVAAFARAVLGATGETRTDRPTEMVIGGSIVMICDGGGVRDPMPAFLHVHVPDVEASFQTAVQRGVTVLEEPEDKVWGDRMATVKDPWGNIWQIATGL